jgi:hypothetical protein
VKESSEFAWLPLPDALKRVRYSKRRRLLNDAAAAAGCIVVPASVGDDVAQPVGEQAI